MTSGRLPRTSGKDLLAALRRNGWEVVSTRGSHHYLRNPTRGGLVTVPVHGTKTLELKTMSSILRQAELTAEELKEML